MVAAAGRYKMPFIGQLVHSFFGADSLREDAAISNPAFSVGEGLAFMGYIEIQKYQALKELKQQVSNILSSCVTQSKVSRPIQEPFVDALWNSVVKDFQTWSASDRLGTTLRCGIVGEGFSVDTVDNTWARLISALSVGYG